MEQAKPDTDPNPEPTEKDPAQTPDPKPAGQIPNGDDKSAKVLEAEHEKEDTKPPSIRKVPSAQKSVRWNPELVSESRYLDYDMKSSGHPASSTSVNIKDTMNTVRNVLGRWGKKVGEASKKAEDLAGNTWQHLKTGPSFTDAAIGRIAQGTKVLVEGGYEKIFRQSFETSPEERLVNSYACYLSTSAGPVMGVLYLSTSNLAFCSDKPLSYSDSNQTEWSYYKVVLPLHQLKAVNPSSSRANSNEKYIQVISVDNHEFWYMGFLNYGSAIEFLQNALQDHNNLHYV